MIIWDGSLHCIQLECISNNYYQLPNGILCNDTENTKYDKIGDDITAKPNTGDKAKMSIILGNKFGHSLQTWS